MDIYKIKTIRHELEKQLGEEVTISIYQKYKKNTLEYTGRLSELYPSVFIIDLGIASKSTRRLSFSYADILTGTIELQFK